MVCPSCREEELIVRGIKAGEFGYVKKPYRRQELISKIYSSLNIS